MSGTRKTSWLGLQFRFSVALTVENHLKFSQHKDDSLPLTECGFSFAQATSTWLLFTWFKIHFLYMSTFLALLQAVLPLFPNWLAALPAGAQLALECRYLEAVVLMVLHVYIMDYGVVKIHKEIPGHNGYLTGLSIAGGMALFTPALKVSQALDPS